MKNTKAYLTIGILIVSICITLLLIIYAINNNKVTKASTTPVTNKAVILDAGHGLPDERCTIIFKN